MSNYQKVVTIPFLNVIEETAKAVKKEKNKKVGILCSQTTTEEGFYQRTFKEYGIEILAPTDEQQPILNEIIGAVMKGSQGA